MRKTLLAGIMVIAGFAAQSQSKFPPPDKSPMDMCYFPVNYPILKIQNKVSEPPVARVVYSRPTKNGRTVYGELVEFGKVWRLGANEATEIEFYKDAKFAGNKVKKGRYSIFAIPYEDRWTIILNRDTDVWGAFQYDSTKDVFRTDVRTEKIAEPAESFTIMFDKDTTGINLIIAWDDIKASIPFSY